MTIATAMPGGAIAHASTLIAFETKAFSIRRPQEIRLGSPRPRNASAVSAKIAIATVRTVLATRSGATCGSTWRKMILESRAPSACALRTYTRSRTLFTCARMMRAVPVQ